MKTCFVKSGGISAMAVVLDKGIQITLGGGESHIGCVALCLPYVSGEKRRCTVSAITVPTHRDDVVARQVGEAVCARMQIPVSVTAGIHYPELTKEGLADIMKNVSELTDLLLEQLQELCGADQISGSSKEVSM